MFSSLITKVALKKSGLGVAQKDLNSMLEPAKKNKDGSQPSPLPDFLTTNPFASIEYPPTWKAWMTPNPPPTPISTAPAIGTKAPSTPQLRLPSPEAPKPTIIVFLRGGGCPFAEKTFLSLRKLANKHTNMAFIAVSHSSPGHTSKWVEALGGAWNVRIVVDESRTLYAAWGLNMCSVWEVFGPVTWMNQRKLGNQEGIWARHVEDRSAALEESRLKGRGQAGKGKSADRKKGAGKGDEREELVEVELGVAKVEGGSGNRWQVGGAWAVNEAGVIRWGGRSKSADDVPELELAVEALGVR